MGTLDEDQSITLLAQLQLVEKIPEVQRKECLQLILSNCDNNILNALKLPNKAVVIPVLTALLKRADFSLASTEENILTVQTVRDMMSMCLQAVSHHFEGNKSFEHLLIYLKMALKLFVCIGIEG